MKRLVYCNVISSVSVHCSSLESRYSCVRTRQGPFTSENHWCIQCCRRLVAGMATMMFFGATACLLKYSTSAALKMLHVMIASTITRQIRKNICKLRSILHLRDDFVPVAMPRRSPVDTRRIDELLERGIDVIEEPALASLSYCFVSKITNAYHKVLKKIDPKHS